MTKNEAIKYLLDNMNENSVIRGITIDNILNETVDPKILDCCKILNFSLCPNGTIYDNSKQSFMGAITEKMYEDRKKYKNLMLESKKKYEETRDKKEEYEVSRYHNLQLSKKIMLNSLYGSLSNEYCRWFNFYHAEAITTSGQTYIRHIDKKINKYLKRIVKNLDEDFIVASDTDSVYVNMEEVVKKIEESSDSLRSIEDKTKKELKTVEVLDNFCESCLQKEINSQFKKLSDNLNVFVHRTEMKRETIANKGIWKAKKMYILNAWNIEGVQFDEPVLKIQGIEAVRSSTPQACRKHIKESLKYVMNKTESELKNYVSEFKRDFKNMTFDEIAFPRGVSDMEKYHSPSDIYIKGTPINAKAALLFNYMIKKHKLKNIEPIRSGDKIKFCYLKMPNPVGDEVVANIDSLPEELDMMRYIDYDKQFELSFLKPLKSITNVIDWEPEKRNTLDRFFK